MENTYFRRTAPAIAPSLAEAAPAAPATPGWTPLVEVFEDAMSIRVLAELPGVHPRDVSVALEGNRLTIAGTKRRKEHEPQLKVHRHERTYGEFRRTFRLGSVVEFGTVSATHELGLLTVTLPKAESAKRHQIAITD